MENNERKIVASSSKHSGVYSVLCLNNTIEQQHHMLNALIWLGFVMFGNAYSIINMQIIRQTSHNLVCPLKKSNEKMTILFIQHTKKLTCTQTIFGVKFIFELCLVLYHLSRIELHTERHWHTRQRNITFMFIFLDSTVSLFANWFSLFFVKKNFYLTFEWDIMLDHQVVKIFKQT